MPLLTGRVSVHVRQLRGRGRGLVRPALALLDRSWSEWLPVWSWAVEHPEGTIVVDGGMAAAWRAPWWDAYGRFALRADVRREDALEVRLRDNGIDPGSVRRHVFTHLHVDHVGAFSSLPGAEVLVSAREWQAARSRTGRLRGLIVPCEPRRLRAFAFDDAGVGPFASTHAVTRDRSVLLLPTPGHSPGHVSVLVGRDGDRVLIAGDAVYSERQLLAGWIDGISLDGRAARDSIRRLQTLCSRGPTIVLPSHDPQVPERLGRD